jgi:superfamily I DNA and/or RNA helicase
MFKLLQAGVVPLRVGDMTKTSPDLQEFCLEYLLSQHRKQNPKEKINEKKLFKLLPNAKVICATTSKVGDQILKPFKFTRVVIDEVSQAIGLIIIITY